MPAWPAGVSAGHGEGLAGEEVAEMAFWVEEPVMAAGS